MSEKGLRQFTQALEGIKVDSGIFDARADAWSAAVTIKDYAHMTRAGNLLHRNIYGTPYQIDLDALRDRKLSDDLATVFEGVRASGVRAMRFMRPSMSEIFNHNLHFENRATREAYLDHFYEMLHDFGKGDIREVGPEHYLEQIPPFIDAIVYLGPDGTKSFVTSDGYVATGFNIEPDLDRPFGQRGGECGFLRSEYSSGQSRFNDMSRQLTHLSGAGRSRFVFETYDGLGYRPYGFAEQGMGLKSAWSGWEKK